MDTPPAKRPRPRPNDSAPEPVSILLEEYRQLYGLALYRLNALDQRIPVASAILTTVLGCIVLLPPPLQIALLFGLPLSLLWLSATTFNHARSFEDALRRIEEIEHAVNEYAGVVLLQFQSCHPSRGTLVGGRTGKQTADAVLGTSVVLITTCVLAMVLVVHSHIAIVGAHAGLCIGIMVALAKGYRELRGYSYQHGPSRV